MYLIFWNLIERARGSKNNIRSKSGDKGLRLSKDDGRLLVFNLRD
jgi:hypothetical protein